MIGLRGYLAGFLVLVLVLTSQSMAIARGMPGAAGYAEYCLSETAVMVPVDADGNPVGPAHICPEFALSLLDMVATAPVLPVPVEGRVTRATHSHSGLIRVIRTVAGSARGPPEIS